MITDEIMDAIDMLIKICSNEEQVLGMKSVREMLANFDEQGWLCMDRPSDCYEWLEGFLSCARKEIVGEEDMSCLNCHFYDKNDSVNAYGTCEPQDKDFHCTHKCNLSQEQIKELEQLTGHKR